MKPAVAALAALAALALQSCAHRLPVGSDGLTYEARRARLESVADWETRGRVAIDTGERGAQASFRWRQTGDALELTLRGPIGVGALQVAGTPASLTVTSRGDTRTLDDPETQLSELLGWWLPVGSLHAWLLGLADPQFPGDPEVGPEGTLQTLDQRLWRVDYSAYQLAPAPNGTADAALLVPRRIDMQHCDLKVRLTIDDWHASSP